MRKLFVVFSLAILISCEKDKLISDSDIPGWLKNKIPESEELIESNPNSIASITAWLQFKYDGEYYFEFDNPISSSTHEVYRSDGTMLSVSDNLFFEYSRSSSCLLGFFMSRS